MRDQTEQNLQQRQGGRNASPIPAIQAKSPPGFAARQQEILALQKQLMEDYQMAAADIDHAEKLDCVRSLQMLEDMAKSLGTDINSDAMPAYIAQVESLIAGFPQTDDGDIFAQQFLERKRQSGCNVIIDKNLRCSAAYRAFSHIEPNRGFLNEIAVNPDKFRDILSLSNSTVHEYFHSFQTAAAPALWHSPGNPDTRVIVHPEDWILLESLCERDAFAKQSFFNYLVSLTHPEAREKSARDIVTVDDFHEARKTYPRLEQTLVEVALIALDRIKYKEVGNFSFRHSYEDTSIGNYSIGMNNRRLEGDHNYTFIRLELHDFWQVGNYGVGPNALGEFYLEPLFMRRPALLPHHQKQLAALMEKFNIPPLESCPTLFEHQRAQSAPQRKAPEQYFIPAPAQQGAFSPAFA